MGGEREKGVSSNDFQRLLVILSLIDGIRMCFEGTFKKISSDVQSDTGSDLL